MRDPKRSKYQGIGSNIPPVQSLIAIGLLIVLVFFLIGRTKGKSDDIPSKKITPPSISEKPHEPSAVDLPISNRSVNHPLPELIWNSAVITNTVIEMGGVAEPNRLISVQIGGNEPVTTTSSADGKWIAKALLPETGLYDVTIQMFDTHHTVLNSYQRQLDVPFQPPTATPPPTQIPIIPSPQPTKTPTPLPTIKATQPTLIPPDDIDKFIGGRLILRGSGTPLSTFELIVTQKTTTVSYLVTVEADGTWKYVPWIQLPGEYHVTVRPIGANVMPQLTFTTPYYIFGSKGNCHGNTPPFGEFRGNIYRVYPCEHFSLIALRLGLTYRQLIDANPQIKNPDFISAGDMLNVPTPP